MEGGNEPNLPEDEGSHNAPEVQGPLRRPVVQTEADMQRMMNAVAQYFEHQARTQGYTGALYEKFTRLKPPVFAGSTDPIVAEAW